VAGSGSSIKVRFEEMEWIEANRALLERDYAGKYIAVVGSSLVAHGQDPRKVHQRALRKGHREALVHRVLPAEFQGMKFVR
jgi:hypothetical protein